MYNARLLILFKEKFMKKTFCLLTVIASLAATAANAKTEGHYLGINLLRTDAKVKSDSDAVADRTLPEWYLHQKSETDYGVGLSYGYAFNFNSFFITPQVSYDVLKSEVKVGYPGTADDPFSQSVKIKNRLTAQANFGYDLTDKFSAYVPVGISSFRYQIQTSDISTTNTYSKSNGNEVSNFFGLGFSYQPVKHLAINLEYNKFQNLKITSERATFNSGRIKADVELEIVKLGLAYNF
jgi:opacity protein-like surface antigen